MSSTPYSFPMKSLTLALLFGVSAFADDAPVYEKDIAPILRTYCAGCHNDLDRDGGLSVETFAQLTKGGDDQGAPIKAGDAAASYLVKAITGSVKKVMPPKDEPQLQAQDIAMLKRWITAGAPAPAKDESILKNLVVPKLKPSDKRQPVTSAGYSRDGKLVALARYGTVEIRDAATNELRTSMSGFPGKVNAVHFSADAARIVAASGITGLTGVAQIREVADGKLTHEFSNHTDTLYDAEFSPDGALLATAGYDRVIRIWNVADGKPLRSMDVHKGAVFDLAFDPTGNVLASASADETVKLWRVSDGERLDTLNAPQGEQVAVLFTRDGSHVMSTGADKRIHMWRLVSREKPALNPLVHSRFAHETPVVGLAMSADGKFIVSSASDRSLKVWSLPELELRHAYPPQSDITPVLTAIPGTEQFFAARMDGSADRIAIIVDPRGPDSGFKVYPGEGKRHPQFFTTALSQPLGQPAYIVRALPPGSDPAPNGLPVFHLNYENDDDSTRRTGSDSMLHFTAPADGEYLARLSDVRGFGGEKDFHYTLTIRPRRPDFKVTIGGMNPKVSPVSERELPVKVERLDGYDGPVRVDITNLPPGFSTNSPIEIEAGQFSAAGLIFAEPGTANPDDAADKAVKITATASIAGRDVTHDIGNLGNIELGPPARLLVEIVPGDDRSYVKETPGQPLELSIRPGQTTSAKVRATRADFKGRIELGKEDAGRNLPFGTYVDNIGLNGLLIVEGQTEREFFITAAPIAQPGTRRFHLKASGDNGQCTRPVIIRVLPPDATASAK